MYLFLFLCFVLVFLVQAFFSARQILGREAAKAFSAKTGCDLVIYPAAEHNGFLGLLNTQNPPLVPDTVIRNYDQVTADLSALTAVDTVFPLSAAPAFILAGKESEVQVRCYTIGEDVFTAFFTGFEFLAGNLTAAADSGCIITRELAVKLLVQYQYPAEPGSDLLLVRDTGTYLDVLGLQVRAVADIPGPALFMHAADFSFLSGRSGVAASATAGIVLSRGDFTRSISVQPVTLPDSFFFELLGDPEEIHTVPEPAAVACNVILVKTSGQQDDPAGQLREMIAAKGTDLLVAGIDDLQAAVVKGAPYRWFFILPAVAGILLVFLLACCLNRVLTNNRKIKPAGEQVASIRVFIIFTVAVSGLAAVCLNFMFTRIIRITDLWWIDKRLFSSLITDNPVFLSITPEGTAVSLAAVWGLVLLFPLVRIAAGRKDGIKP